MVYAHRLVRAYFDLYFARFIRSKRHLSRESNRTWILHSALVVNLARSLVRYNAISNRVKCRRVRFYIRLY